MRLSRRRKQTAFTLVESIVALGVLGIGIAYSVGALTKFNTFAATERNSTGAYAVVTNQIDLFQSMSPFNPQKGQIPTYTEPSNNPSNLASYDMTVGTHTIGYVTKNPVTGVSSVTDKWPVYQYKDPATGSVVVVQGTVTIQVTDLNLFGTTPSSGPYQATVTIAYDYLNHTQAKGNPYTLSMSSIRSSDI